MSKKQILLVRHRMSFFDVMAGSDLFCLQKRDEKSRAVIPDPTNQTESSALWI